MFTDLLTLPSAGIHTGMGEIFVSEMGTECPIFSRKNTDPKEINRATQCTTFRGVRPKVEYSRDINTPRLRVRVAVRRHVV